MRFRTGAVGPRPRRKQRRRPLRGGGGQSSATCRRTRSARGAQRRRPGPAPQWSPRSGVRPATRGRDAAGGPDAAGRRTPRRPRGLRRRAPARGAPRRPRRRGGPQPAGRARDVTAAVVGLLASRHDGGRPRRRWSRRDRGGDRSAGDARRPAHARHRGRRTLRNPGCPVPPARGVRRPGFDAEALRRRILAVLRPGDEERPGLFHPSRLELGGAVYVSAVLAAVAALPGVDAVEVAEARRLSEPAGHACTR